jgi:hypothetical protein
MVNDAQAPVVRNLATSEELVMIGCSMPEAENLLKIFSGEACVRGECGFVRV